MSAGVTPEQEALVAAYALAALEPAEAAEAEELLRGSMELRRVFAEALETSILLAVATMDDEPPAGLRDRIVDAVRAEGTHGGADR